MEDPSEAAAELRERPTSEAEVMRLEQLRQEVRDQLSSVLGLSAWSDVEGSEAGCADFSGQNGRTVFLKGLLLTGGVPDALWAQAVEVVSEATAGYEFGAPVTVVDQPGNHEVVLRGARESLLRFGTGSANATLQLETGCHLPAAVRDAG